MCLEAACADGHSRRAAVESASTAADFAAAALCGRGVPEAELRGWTVAMEEGGRARKKRKRKKIAEKKPHI